MTASHAPADYLRDPAVLGDVLVVVADDDLWIADRAGGRAHRLTDSRARAERPVPSPDGTALAFTASEESHPELFLMALEGGPAERRTHLGASVMSPRAWHEGDVVVATNARLPFVRDSQLLRVPADEPHPRPMGWGTAHEVAFGTDGAVLVGRNTTNQGRWKRYRGGTAGQLWLDPIGDGSFRRLLPDLDGDVSCPMLIHGRAWFISDHEGVGNLYSCALDGTDLRRHTDHEQFYARSASTDQETIVYAVGGDVWRLDPRSGDAPARVDLRLRSPRTQRQRRFVDPAKWLQNYAVHPKGTHIALRVRGRPFTMPLWEGPVTQLGVRDGVNHRLIDWLPDGDRLVGLSDRDEEERLELLLPDGSTQRFESLDLGVVLTLEVNPARDLVALADQSGRLRVVDLDDGSVRDVAVSPHGIDHPRWSPDGRWLAWSHRESNWHTASIRLWDADGGSGGDEPLAVTDGRVADRAPAWDPGGRYLYWISGSRFEPVPDGVYFDHGFPMPDVVVAAVLAEGGTSPLEHDPHPPGRGRAAPAGERPRPASAAPEASPPDRGEDDPDDPEEAPGDSESPKPVVVDVDELAERTVRLPFPTGRYRAVTGLRGKVLAMGLPLRPSPLTPPRPGERPGRAQLEVLDLATGKHEVQISGVNSYAVSTDRRTLVYAKNKRLRAVVAGVKPPEGPAAEGPPRVSGWLALNRISVEVSPAAEWRQILLEAWRLQRELFWHPEMSGVDWDGVRERYVGLVDRVASRAELSDLVWQMFGELGTGHAYERGGDHPRVPQAPVGHLGVDIEWDGRSWRVVRSLMGDPTHPTRRMPLRAPGARVADGAELLAVDGVPVDATTSPSSLLVNRANREITVTVADPDRREARVRTLSSETPLRYADWVAGNRQRVREASDGRLGYVHVPDMGARGFAEFHRQYLGEFDRDGLIVDVRFNGGGNVSSLLLEKLAGQRIGYQLRRTGAIEPHPHHAPAGPLVAITNERCGSDGDIFTHAWKRLGLGPVVGTRTWGGVIGIQPRNPSVDGTVTTQPGFAFWFDDVGFGVENQGTEPTHPVQITPQDAAAGRDPQMDTAIELALAAVEARGARHLPDLDHAPDLRPPSLPPR